MRHATLDYVPVGILVINQHYEVTFWNRILEEWTNIPRSQIVGQPICDLFPHFCTPKYSGRLEGIFAGGPPAVFSSQLHHHIIPSQLWNGELRVQQTTVTAIENDSGGYDALLAIQDMTQVVALIAEAQHSRDQALAEVKERQRAEDRLRASESELRALFAAMDDLIFITDQTGKLIQFIRTNQPIPLDNVEGKTIHEIFMPKLAAMFETTIQQAFEQQVSVQIDYEYFDEENRRHTYGGAMTPIANNAVMCVVRDVTDQVLARQRETDLRVEREKAQILADFIRTASHDFRTPLSVLNTGIYLLRQQNQDMNRQQERLNRLEMQVKYIERLVEGLFTISRLEHLDQVGRRRMDLRLLVHNLDVKIRQRAEERRLLLYVEVPAEPCFWEVDEVSLTHALEEILVNAVQFTPKGSIRLRLEQVGDEVSLSVTDTGIGIPADDLPHIFDLFYKVDKARTYQVGGLGMGLYIAQRIIHGHRGRIEVSSEPGQGSRFRVTLPHKTTGDTITEAVRPLNAVFQHHMP